MLCVLPDVIRVSDSSSDASQFRDVRARIPPLEGCVEGGRVLARPLCRQEKVTEKIDFSPKLNFLWHTSLTEAFS